MITNSTDFLSQLADIQNNNTNNTIERTTDTKSEPRIIIDANARIIDDETFNQNFITVATDHNAETVFFEINRYFDDVDLLHKTCLIKFQNANGEIDFDTAIQPQIQVINGVDKLIFGWKLSQKATQCSGKLLFQIMFYSLDDNKNFDYRLNTTIATTVISNGIEYKSDIYERYPTLLYRWEEQMQNLYNSMNAYVDNSGNLKITY